MTDTVTPTQADDARSLKWLDHNLQLAALLMRSSVKAGNGHDNFAAHEAHYALSRAKAAIEAEATQAAEIARLRELVASAYAEGWGDAVLGIVSEGPDAWNGSDARAALSTQPSEQEGGE